MIFSIGLKYYNPGSGLEKPDFSSVLAQIDRFIGPVYEAILREDEFFGTWSSKESIWKMQMQIVDKTLRIHIFSIFSIVVFFFPHST